MPSAGVMVLVVLVLMVVVVVVMVAVVGGLDKILDLNIVIVHVWFLVQTEVIFFQYALVSKRPF